MPKKNRQATRTTPGFTGPFKGNAQQGTLFDVGTLPKTGEEIGPRGYSLNRSRQFQEVFQGKKGELMPGTRYRAGASGPSVHLFVKHVAKDPEDREKGTESAVKPDEHPYGPSSLGEKGPDIRRSLGRAKSKLIDTLARSTAPVESTKGLTEISMQPKDPDRAGSYQGKSQRSAVNRISMNVTRESPEATSWPTEDRPDIPFSYPEKVKRPEQRGPVDPQSELTLLHELGHHESARTERPSSEYDTPHKRGEEEGFADAFATTHYREDTRTARWHGRTDPREHTYLARGGPRDWQKFSVSPVSDYRRALGSQNVAHEWTMGKTLEESGKVERHERPMLDEQLPEHQQIFSTHMEGWSHRGDEPEQHREGVYKKAAQLTHGRIGRALQPQVEIKRRWGVNRNLGRQW